MHFLQFLKRKKLTYLDYQFIDKLFARVLLKNGNFLQFLKSKSKLSRLSSYWQISQSTVKLSVAESFEKIEPFNSCQNYWKIELDYFKWSGYKIPLRQTLIVALDKYEIQIQIQNISQTNNNGGSRHIQQRLIRHTHIYKCYKEPSSPKDIFWETFSIVFCSCIVCWLELFFLRDLLFVVHRPIRWTRPAFRDDKYCHWSLADPLTLNCKVKAMY